MPDLHRWVAQQIDGAEALARAGTRGWWEPWVLRRCAADRKILEHHAPADGAWNPYACEGCGSDDYGWNVDHTNDCPTLLALAEGYGLTEEQRAGLDRPEPERPKPSPGFMIPNAISEDLYRAFLDTRPMEPSPEEKAVKILEPELKKIRLYMPTTEDPGPSQPS